MISQVEFATARASRRLSRQSVQFQDIICAKMRPLALARNAKLFHVEDRATDIYFISKGSVVTLVPHPMIGQIPAEVYHSGDWFGLPATLGGRPRLATVEARQDCLLLAITLVDLLHAIRGNETHIKAALELMADDSESHMFHGVDLLISDAKLRLCSRLLTLAGRRLTYLPPPDVMIPFSKEELALTSNMSRQKVHEVLSELVADGICELGYGRVVIRNTQALAELVSSSISTARD